MRLIDADALNGYKFGLISPYAQNLFHKIINEAPTIVQEQRTGRWILVQRGKYVDVNCSECGFSRIKEFAYNYAVEDISEQEFRDYAKKNKMNFCECCGTKMEVQE